MKHLRHILSVGMLIALVASVSAQSGGGTVVAWGRNDLGQTNIPAGLTNVTALGSGIGYQHSAVLRSDGTVVAWGFNNYGQADVPPGLSNVIAVSAAGLNTMALKADSTIVTWGDNHYGQATIPAGLSNVTAIAAGSHSVVLKNDGTVLAWGYNPHGQATVPSNLSAVTAIAGGGFHTVALKSNGTVVVWGNNDYGQLNIPAGLSGVTAIAGGGFHTVVLKSNGTVVAWGLNQFGQATVPAGLSNVVAIAGGLYHSLALRRDGTVAAWGNNGYGQTNIPAGLSNVVAIAAGQDHNVALVTPLAITQQPQSVSVTAGGTTTFTVSAIGIPSLIYQWRKEGVPITGATNSFLTLIGVASSNAGNYDVVVTNLSRSITSSKAVLQVLPPNAPSLSVNSQLAVGMVAVSDSASITISGGFPSGLIFYTVDGTTPTTSSSYYTGPFSITQNATVKAMSLSADFTQSSEAPAINVVVLPAYSLATTVSGSGQIAVTPPNGPYISNSVVTLTAVAATNWAFDHWSGALSGSENPAAVTMNGPRSVQAVFVPAAYPLTLSTPGGGSITANAQSIAAATYYPTSSIVSLSATPSNGWSFLRWQGTVSGTANPLNISMNQAQDVQAIFGTVVSTNIGGSGSVGMSTTNPVPYGTVVTLTAVPTPGYRFVTWSGAVSGTNNPATFTVNAATPTVGAFFTPSSALTILRQPTNTPVILGNSANLNFEAAGTAPLTYQWRKSGVSIGGATGTNYTIASALASDAGNYDVVVINGVGGSLTSSVATLTVLLPPTISQPPQSRAVIIGSNTSFSVTAAGTPTLTYQWRKNGFNIGGAVATNLTLTSVTTNDGAGYDVVVSNPYGSITSSVAALTVVFPPSITTQPTNQTLASGSIASLGVTATGTDPLSYQWQQGGTNITGATNSVFTLNPALTNNAGDYRVVVSNPYGQETSTVATLTVFIPASLSSGPVSQLVAAHDTATFSVAAFGYPALNYQWRFDGADLPGATRSSLVITNVGTNHLGYYWVEARNAYSAVTSPPAALLMSPSLRTPYTGLTAIWGKEATLAVSAWGSGNLSYQWFKDGQAVLGATNATIVYPTVQVSDGGLYSVVISSPYGSVTNTPAQLVVNPANITLELYAGIVIEGVPGYTYGIEYTTDLTDTHSWQSITNVTLTQPVEKWADTSVNVLSSPKRFYRVTNQ